MGVGNGARGLESISALKSPLAEPSRVKLKATDANESLSHRKKRGRRAKFCTEFNRPLLLQLLLLQINAPV